LGKRHSASLLRFEMVTSHLSDFVENQSTYPTSVTDFSVPSGPSSARYESPGRFS
jgi:hypothetical protein